MPRTQRRRRLGALLLGVALLAAPATRSSQAATSERGYWLVDARGNVYEFGGALFKGSAASESAVVDMAPTPSGQGYWIAAANGGVYAFDAPFLGSMGAVALNQPVVGMAATPSGNGYWLAAADGGVFAFGDAPFLGSMGGVRLNRPVVGMAASTDGKGYWLVAADGGVFSFGVPFFGSLGSQQLDRPIVGMVADPDGTGYWMLDSEGTVFAFSAPHFGETDAGDIDGPIVGFAPTPGGDGYWLADATGDVYHFGAAEYSGEADACDLPAGIVGLVASGPGTVSPPPPARPDCGLSSSTTTTTTTGGDGGSSGGGSSFQIAAVGDTAYTSDQEMLFLEARAHMGRYPLEFVVHAGDFKSGTSSCSDSKFQEVFEVFEGFKAPLIYTPGDNEWVDCSDPLDRLEYLRDVFFAHRWSLGENRIQLTRQSGYPENARWVESNVVFATVNLPGYKGTSPSGSETRARLEADVKWVHEAFDLAEAQRSPAVMIVWHDNPFRNTEPTTHDALKARAKAFGKPVVLVHGDTHSYTLDHPWSDVPNFTRLETYATSDSNRWVLITIDPSSRNVFSFENKRA